jgi:TolB-like protein
MSFVDELKRRNVVRVGVAYGIAAWVLLQVADLVLEAIEAPSWVLLALMLMVGLGFVAALVIAWAYEMTPEGIKKEADVDRSQSIVGHTGKKLDRIIIGFLIVAVAVLLVDRSILTGKVGSEPVAGPMNSSADASRTEPAARATEQGLKVADDNSIAVLPFANRSLQQEDEFFTDGIHDDLLTQLAKVKDLKVISRTSMMKYKDTQLSIPEIASELGVSTILEGGIQRAGQRIRINAQLIDVSNDQHLWAETFDREMTIENIFEIQSEITRQIVTAVRGELSEEESAVLSQMPTDSLEAYEAYLQAQALTNRADYLQESYIQAETWLRKAVELDPSYAQAWASLVEVHGQAVWIGYDSSPQRKQAALDAVQNAVKFGADQAQTLAAEGEYLYRIRNDYPASVEKYRAATHKAPGDSDILERLAVAQRRAGLFDGAIASFEKSIGMDPANIRSATLLADTLLEVNRFDQAVPFIERWMEKYPDARDLRAYRIRAYYDSSGDLTSARSLLDTLTPWVGAEYYSESTLVPLLERDYAALLKAFEIPEIKAMSSNRGWGGYDTWFKGIAHRALGNEAAAQAEFNAGIDHNLGLEITDTQVDGFDQSYLGLMYAGLGRFDEALIAADNAVRIIAAGGDRMFGTDMNENRALVLGMAGKREESLAEIKRLLESPNSFTRWRLHLDPQWDFFRDDERFNELVRPLNLEKTNQ